MQSLAPATLSLLPKVLLMSGLIMLSHSAWLDAEVDQPNANIGSMAPDFVLKDADGQQHAWTQYSGENGLVVLFISTEAVEYIAAVKEAARWLIECGLGVVLVDVSYKVNPLQARQVYRAYQLELPILFDLKRLIAPLYGVEQVPRLFVLDSQLFVRYTGGLADKNSVQTLQVAVRQLLNGQPVTHPQGCLGGVPIRPLPHQLGR